MKKALMGVKLRRLREERGMTQIALARSLDISASYLNQIEQNQRPLTVPILLRMREAFGADIELSSDDGEARMITDLRDALSDAPAGETVSLAELREVAANMPAVGRVLLALHRGYRDLEARNEALAQRLGDGRDGRGEELGRASLAPYEEVRDFFYGRRNHIDELDALASTVAEESGITPGVHAKAIADRLARRHGVRIEHVRADDALRASRRYDATSRVLRLAAHLTPGQHAFEMATQLAFIEAGELLSRIVAEAKFSSNEARALGRIGLASYFAGALVLPYDAIYEAAESLRYDVELLCMRFGVGFETICHRLSTLQRADKRGVPFFFIRVDRAGNISKRQSATGFHFSRVGGTCPLWNLYEAFAQPGRILTQLAQMPDGRTYLWVARTVTSEHGGYGAPTKTFAIGLGCDLRDASRLVYSKGLDLLARDAATPIGVGCKVCEREACAQRAFPPIGKKLAVNENERRVAPYPVKLT